MGKPQQRKTILVVEDNRDELMIYTTLLSFRGYAILAAASFQDALTIATTQRPDLAIIDVNLNDPDRDGCDLVEALRGDERTRDIPIIAHTAFGDVYRNSLERAGCDSILHKPTSPSGLLETIQALIGTSESPEEGDLEQS